MQEGDRMISLEEAKRRAEQELRSTDLHIDGGALDDGQFYIFGYAEKVDISPIGVNKDTGEVIQYFPPEHLQAYMNAVDIKTQSQITE